MPLAERLRPPETGVTDIRTPPPLDAGGMLAHPRTPIGPDETAGELEERLAEIGAPLNVESNRQVVADCRKPGVDELASHLEREQRVPEGRLEDAAE